MQTIKLEARPVGLKFKPPESALSKFDKSIRSAAKADSEIEILGEIGFSGWSEIYTTTKMVKDRLKSIGAKSPVTITINSPGGDAFEGISIYNLLREHQGPVSVNVIGIAASAASVIAMAGQPVKMSPASMLMIHSASGLVMGNQEDMREFAAVLDNIDKSVAGLYAARTGISEADVLAMMKKEKWMAADEAVSLGFADVAVKDDKKKAKSSIQVPSSLLAAIGNKAMPVVRLNTNLPGASGNQIFLKGPDMNTQQQIQNFENKRAASAERMTAIMAKAAEDGSTLDEAQTQEYDTLQSEVESIDGHLVRLRKHEVTMVAAAKTVTVDDGTDPTKGAAARANSNIISVKQNLAPGQKMGRYAMALYQAGGNAQAALSIVQSNKSWMDTSPELAKVFMTAVATGDTTTSGWASELVYAQNLSNEFIEYLRPMTILGKLTNVRRVPFNVRMGSQTAGSTGNWVGQAKPIPVSKLTTSSLSLGITKAAGLVTIDDELARSSSPSAELLVRDDLASTISVLLDDSFINPNYGGLTNIQPASMLYGVTPVTPTGITAAALAADINTLFASAIAANLDPTSGTFIMSPTTALKLSLMLTSLGQAQYPSININGGTLFGLPVVVSNSAKIAGSPQFGEMIVVVFQREILVADEGGVTIDISKEASLELKDNPTNSGAGGETATSVVSMFQTNSMAIRAIRYVNWAKRRTTAAAFIQAANYTG